jgi:hypothetical protein
MGLCSVEDLWQMRVEQLDIIYKDLRRDQRETEEDTLLDTETSGSPSELLQLQIDVVKHIVEVKQLEAKVVKDAILRSKKRSRLLSILADKEDAELQGKSTEEIKALIEELT